VQSTIDNGPHRSTHVECPVQMYAYMYVSLNNLCKYMYEHVTVAGTSFYIARLNCP